MGLFSQEIIKVILGIKEDVDMTPKEMSNNLTVTFFPTESTSSDNVLNFSNKLREVFLDIGVNIISYEGSLVVVPFFKKIKYFFRVLLFNIRIFLSGKLYFVKIKGGKKVKKGVVIVMCGEGKTGNLPIDNTMGFKYNPVITIVDKSEGINDNSSFYDHMDMALDLFAWNMTNILITVSDTDWRIYSFNASYPKHYINEGFRHSVLNSLIPKIAAPVRPPNINNFIIDKDSFDPEDNFHRPFVQDLINSGPMLQKTGLYPAGKNIDNLKFRNNFYRWIGSILLDKRNGMSYGFLARQLPIKLGEVIRIEDANKDIKNLISGKDYFYYKNKLYIIFNIHNKRYIIDVPEVWVLTSRSGSDKTNLNIKCDILKMGLVSGQMFLNLPVSCNEKVNARPSFDTGVILAHSLSSAILASILNYFKPGNKFSKELSNNGFALAHWHGYIDPKYLDDRYNIYGYSNPSVSCSSYQSSIYAFLGKNSIDDIIKKINNYIADIHIEPHHGTNMTFSSLVELSKFLLSDEKISQLGHEYLKLYKGFDNCK